MKINVLLFATVAEAVGARELAIELPDGLCVQEAFRQLSAGWPSEARRAAAGAAFAVNEAYVEATGFVLGDGDTLAVIPPVSGG